MDNQSQPENGLFSTVTHALKTVRAAVENRVELFVVEWQEERLRLVDNMLLLLVGAVCALMALILATFIIVVLFWETHRIVVLTLLTVFYLGIAAAAFWALSSRTRRWRPFSATLDQIKKDRACFEDRN